MVICHSSEVPHALWGATEDENLFSYQAGIQALLLDTRFLDSGLRQNDGLVVALTCSLALSWSREGVRAE